MSPNEAWRLYASQAKWRGNDENGNGGEAFAPNTYACRPPGAYHGPFKSEKGCVLLEIHYYA